MVFPQIRCLPDVSGARYAKEESHCGAICGETLGRLQAQLPYRNDHLIVSKENDRLADTFLINTSNKTHDFLYVVLYVDGKIQMWNYSYSASIYFSKK